ncbi:M domain protein [Desulfosporosinus nitroreducens]|uniref:M domain protein n=1 Tax=Desulfosporosinus nitroreducens TaxID=2018668 RepID=A0ABT8QSS7_9FIRM|nr:M domain protein [Desulfosporosinus nitroreducens]MDO0824412.1 M domain protein [Desulfosporosinus nitroreducens]
MEIEIKEMFRLILNKLNGLESKMDKLESKMELRMDNLESKMELRMDNLESRQDEIYMVVKAIEHNNQVHRAELDNLKYTVTNVEGTINTIGDVITKRKAI